MGKDDVIEVDGTVIEPLPNAQFKVEITGEGGEKREITAHLSGRMRMNYIKILPGDAVTVQISVYDLSKGRITYRHKNPKLQQGNHPAEPEVTLDEIESIETEAIPEQSNEESN